MGLKVMTAAAVCLFALLIGVSCSKGSKADMAPPAGTNDPGYSPGVRNAASTGDPVITMQPTTGGMQPAAAAPGGYGPPQSGTVPQAGMQPGGMPPQAAPAGADPLDQLMTWERQDFGVAPTSALHNGPMEGHTPTQIPGGQAITTKGLVPLIKGGQVPVVILDVLGGQQTLPNAIPASFAAQAGSFNDQTQQQLGQLLAQATRGNKQIPVVLYCLGPTCWMSYNASLRAISLGYTNVLWYRGGVEAWQQAGLPFAQTQQAGSAPPPQGGGYQPSGQQAPGGYTQAPGGYAPPQGGGYQGAAPQQGGYAPPQGGYAQPQSGGYTQSPYGQQNPQ